MVGHAIIKTCGCGRSYNRKTWKQLRYVGRQHVPEDDFGPEETIELRDCVCHSTIAVKVANKPR